MWYLFKFIRSGFKTSPKAQFLCWAEGFNTRNIKYIPAFESLVPPWPWTWLKVLKPLLTIFRPIDLTSQWIMDSNQSGHLIRQNLLRTYPSIWQNSDFILFIYWYVCNNWFCFSMIISNRSQVQGSTFRVKDKGGIEDPKSSLQMFIFPSNCQFSFKFWIRLGETDAFLVNTRLKCSLETRMEPWTPEPLNPWRLR